ncbi:hypothetical protein [Nitrosopumilus ureiphilus]|jgi:hypothetical protein|uniref:Uncharacterized protein n=1 Tax=Nitrosopumilus ureiphilus TaxID=1470067 RepID=A0A7D5M7V8_9ARCH|nr:hypothetical protein [Nitrosopumilus ureiphilus]QLH06650.1 hypothetical protein C5F50_05860 [Nitrosopumilus ureiphilus]
MAGMIILGISVVLALFFATNSVFADSVDTSEQITLSKDLENNSVAQDILKKIEKSKKWIAQIEQRNFEALEKQKELEKKRAEAIQILEKKLKKWEDLWEYYTFDKMLESALENSPAKYTSSTYDHPLKFTASKINAGRDALHKVILEGGGPEKAREAFVIAAKITRAEMLAANSLFNVINNNAYYNQQILFSSDGNFEEIISGEQLRKYYQDYRTNPGYLQANPFDKISWEDLGKNNPDTECRQDQVLVYRTHADDYVCTTEYTAEMWVHHKMGTVVTDTFLETKDPVDVKKFQQDRIFEKVKNLNSKIESMQKHNELKISDTKKKYTSIFVNMETEQNEEEKKVIEKFNNSGSMSKKTFSQQISDIREKYKQLEETVVDEQSRILEILENQHQTSINNFVKNYESDSEMRIIWNSQNPVFEAEISLS